MVSSFNRAGRASIARLLAVRHRLLRRSAQKRSRDEPHHRGGPALRRVTVVLMASLASPTIAVGSLFNPDVVFSAYDANFSNFERELEQRSHQSGPRNPLTRAFAKRVGGTSRTLTPRTESDWIPLPTAA